MERTYELMFVVRPDLTEEELDKLVSTLESQANAAGAAVKNIERMGKRRLAYSVRKFNDGMYVLFTLLATGEGLHELERRLRVAEPVIKFLTVRMDEEIKRADKMKKLRDAKRRHVPAPPVAPAATAEPGSEPAPATV